ncbi:MAG: hypothetical protein WBH47_09770 [Streptosporangiaceae bacterium]
MQQNRRLDLVKRLAIPGPGKRAAQRSRSRDRVGRAARRGAGLRNTVLGDTVLGESVLRDTVLGDTVLGDTVLADGVTSFAIGQSAASPP